MDVGRFIAQHCQQGFTLTALQQRYHLGEIIFQLQRFGWSWSVIARALEKSESWDYRIGSPFFEQLWSEALSRYRQSDTKVLLQILLAQIDFPRDLSGSNEETKMLLTAFYPNLRPDSPFWKELAQLVDRSFPNDSLSQKGLFQRQIHQLRYLISCQQAQWVRERMKSEGMTDAEALAKFLKTKKRRVWYRKTFDFDLKDSARLHNKVAFISGKAFYPDHQESANLKILLAFHTEFIIDCRGHFLNEVDPELTMQNGVVNGASFNYASQNNHRHKALDIDPVTQHDPQFRKQILANNGQRFVAPKWLPQKFAKKSQEDWERSYFNNKGLYAQNGRSNAKAVKKVAKAFKRLIAKA